MAISPVTAIGVWFYAIATKRYLYLMRNDVKHPESWGLPGGKVEQDETLIDAMTRECTEEMGSMPPYIKLAPIEKFTTSDGKFFYHTFYCVISEEFIPVLNDEHLGYAWVNATIIPRPLHQGLWATVNFDAVQHKIKTMEQQALVTHAG